MLIFNIKICGFMFECSQICVKGNYCKDTIISRLTFFLIFKTFSSYAIEAVSLEPDIQWVQLFCDILSFQQGTAWVLESEKNHRKLSGKYKGAEQQSHSFQP